MLVEEVKDIYHEVGKSQAELKKMNFFKEYRDSFIHFVQKNIKDNEPKIVPKEEPETKPKLLMRHL